MIFAIAREIYSWFDHSGWSDNAHPDPNAKIINIKSEKVRYAKNDTKFETTIEFSDGFYYKTCKTKRKERFIFYTIEINEELMKEIINNAIVAHAQAIDEIKSKSME